MQLCQGDPQKPAGHSKRTGLPRQVLRAVASYLAFALDEEACPKSPWDRQQQPNVGLPWQVEQCMNMTRED